MSDPHLNPSAALLGALRKLLRPLLRLLISHGVTFPFLSELLKEIYVDVAARDFQIDDKVSSDSRISLLSGVHRKDVRRLRGATRQVDAAPLAVSLGAQVIATWISEKKYLDAEGHPKLLPLRTAGTRASFDSLAAEVARQDLRPRVVLDELLRLGIVSVNDDIVKLEVEAFVPNSGFDEKAHYFGQNIRDHIATSARNLQNTPPALLERAVSYHALREQDVSELHALAERYAMEALKAVNAAARKMKRANATAPDATSRINFGLYFFTADTTHDDDEPED